METKERKRTEYVATLPCGCVVMWAAVGDNKDLADFAKSAAAIEKRTKKEVAVAPLTVPLETLPIHGMLKNTCPECPEKKPARKKRTPKAPKETADAV